MSGTVLDIFMLAGGGLLLYLGAEWLVAGAAGLARSLGVSALIIGLTVVAYGTSTPEVIVGMQAAIAGHSEIALGNVLGSNIANLGLILGLAALLRPTRIDGTLLRRELPLLVVSALAVPLLLLDGEVQWWEGAGLMTVAALYTAWMVLSCRCKPPTSNACSRSNRTSTRQRERDCSSTCRRPLTAHARPPVI